MDFMFIFICFDEGMFLLSCVWWAVLGSFVGVVVDWYDFLFYGIIVVLVFNCEFFL